MGDIASQAEVVRTLTQSIKSGALPHLLFYGPPGTGKTSTILAVARELYGPDLMKSRVMELNASDERGIAVVREKVKAFAMSAVGTGNAAPGTGASIPFKLIILDEADSLTADAQAALRRTIEAHSRVTRFCIICNYISRIIDPLASRCSKFRFKPLEREAMVTRLQSIADAEGVKVTDGVSRSRCSKERRRCPLPLPPVIYCIIPVHFCLSFWLQTLSEILRISGGDMRKAITFMQSASVLYDKEITEARVVEISGIFPDADLERTMQAIKAGTLDGARRQAESIIASGYSINGVLERISDAVISDSGFNSYAKAAITEKIAIAEKRLADGADEDLQLQDVLCHAARAAKGKKCKCDEDRNVIM
jgi:replication factor C subunit 2/4